MSDEGQHLHALFPGDDQALATLKGGNAHFRVLADRHHAMTKEIHRIEHGLEPASDDRLEALKKDRLSTLDQIAALVADCRQALAAT